MRRRSVIALALAAVSVWPTVGATQKILEPHMPSWEQFFKIEWEPGEWRGHPVVQGYLYNISPKTIGEVQLRGILGQKVSWVAAAPIAPFSRQYFVDDAPLVQVAPQQPASYRVRVYSYSEILGPLGRGRVF